ncbi:MAG: aminotransferase class V-fold PLP-dependent enzyme [Johnsonella sp.]|nr:aminotransferase class V-fold PLP-dependent enzyme [Johnsonella sp.]
MKKIYLDNAASSFPKAPGVSEAVKYYMDEIGASINRSTYESAVDAGMTTLSLRERACRIFSFPQIDHLIITPGATAGLNMLIKGFIQKGDHVLLSSLEHNAVMRPIHSIAKELFWDRKTERFIDAADLKYREFASYTRIPYSEKNTMDYESIPKLIRKNTKALIMLHASNVSGSLHDIDKVSAICRKYGIDFILDAAQTAGHYPIDFTKSGLSAMVTPGHKGLLGPQGIGLMFLDPDFAKKLSPLLEGGTGSASDSEFTPDFMPDKFEPGTPNIPAIYGLEKALEFIEEKGVLSFREHEQKLILRFMQALKTLDHIKILGEEGKEHIGVVSLDFIEQDNALISSKLADRYHIMTRCGLHCAPNAHKTYGTDTRGSVRFSFGYFNTESDVDYAIKVIREIV